MSVVATYHDMMHCMLLSYNIDKCLLWHIMSLWHSYCLLLWHTISYDVTYVCRTFENIMFQSFIILSFMFILSYFEFSLNVLFWIIVELYSVKQKTESVQFVDFITPHCHVTLPNMKLNIWIFWHWAFGINFTTRVWRFVSLFDGA